MFPQDLKSTRLEKGLSAKDLCLGSFLRAATLSEIERGKIVPRKSTRLRIESVIGPCDWAQTLAAGEKGHIIYAMREFVAIDEQGAQERIKFAQQVLKLLSETSKT